MEKTELQYQKVMNKVFKQNKKDEWVVVESFENFDEAHRFAQSQICPDLYHSNVGEMYWYSDEKPKHLGDYKVAISK